MWQACQGGQFLFFFFLFKTQQWCSIAPPTGKKQTLMRKMVMSSVSVVQSWDQNPIVHVTLCCICCPSLTQTPTAASTPTTSSHKGQRYSNFGWVDCAPYSPRVRRNFSTTNLAQRQLQCHAVFQMFPLLLGLSLTKAGATRWHSGLVFRNGKRPIFFFNCFI